MTKAGSPSLFLMIIQSVLWLGTNAFALETHKLELEKFRGNWRIQQNIPGYSGSGFRTSNYPSGTCLSPLKGEITLTEGGDYAVWAHGYVNVPYRRGWSVEIAGQKLNVTHNDSTGKSFSWQKAGLAKNLNRGVNKILIHDADSGFETADAIIITNDMDFDPAVEEMQLRILPPDQANGTLVFQKMLQAVSLNAKSQEVPTTKKQWLNEAKKIKEHLADVLGLWRLPQSGNLNAKVHSSRICDNYRIEKITFETFKDFVVTANLYIPNQASEQNKLPGIVVACGHSMDLGKAYDTYQHVAAGLATQGYVVLIYDPMGQGERRMPENSHGLNSLSTLVGLSAYGVMVRDSMAAVTYLQSRPEVSAEKIGLTGTSGGGGNTFFTMPFDERIKAAVISCFTTSYERFIATGWAHCPCNIVPGVAWDCEQWKILALDAPRPVLVHAGPQDYAFPVEGARQSVDKAQKIYSLYNATDEIALYVGQDHQLGKTLKNKTWLGHSYHPPAREAMYGWFNKFLKNIGTGLPVPEPAHKIFTPEKIKQPGKPDEGIIPDELKVIKNAKLNSRTFKDLINDRIKQIDSQRHEITSREQWEKRVVNIQKYLIHKLNITFRDYISKSAGTIQAKGLNIKKWILTSPDGVPCTGLMVETGHKNAPCMIYVATAKNIVNNDAVIKQLSDSGCNVFVFTPRAYDELGMDNEGIVWRDPPGQTIRTGLLGVDCYLAGYSLLGQRVSDVIAAIKFIATQNSPKNNSRICLYANTEETAQIAAIAGAVYPKISEMVLKTSILSYRAYLQNPSAWMQETMMVPNGYAEADVWETLAANAPKSLLLVNPIADSKAQESIKKIYSLYDQAQNLCFQASQKQSCDTSEIVTWIIGHIK